MTNALCRSITVTLCGAVISLGLGSALILAQEVPQRNCGNEGEGPCPISLTNAVCDTGLRLTFPRVCGCVLRGFFGNCLIPKLCVSCENLTRRRPSIAAFESSWTNWALRNQRDLAQDEPVNWVMHLGTHNSFNAVSDGHSYVQLPNQFYSMTDQLRSGARLLTLDLYQLNDAPRLCHSLGPAFAPVTCAAEAIPLIYPRFPGYRYYANGIKEIGNWLRANPNEIVFINLENYVFDTENAWETGGEGDVVHPLSAHIGPQLLDPPLKVPPGSSESRWPTRREMLAAGRRVIVIDNSGVDVSRVFKQNDHLGRFSDGWSAKNLTPFFPNCSRVAFTADAGTDTFTLQVPTTNASLANGDRVVLRSALEGIDSLPSGVSENGSYHVVNEHGFTYEGSDERYSRFQLAATEGGPPIELTDDFHCKHDDPLTVRKLSGTCGLLAKSPVASNTAFSLVVEERESGVLLFGTLDEGKVAAAAECNASFIVLDKFSASLPHVPFIDAPDFSRQAAAVWSWMEHDAGQNGDCAKLAAGPGRWASANCQLAHRFACARPRSESGRDPLEWQDPLGEDWRITSASGQWEDGHAICRSEFPGYVFGVPVNGYQNRRLKDANTAREDLWLNYSQREVHGRWVIGRLSDVNSPPVADAGPDQAVECGSMTTLNGSKSSDADGDALTYSWTGPFGTLAGPIVTATLGQGTHTILLTVNDGNGGTDTDVVAVTVRDTLAPSMSLTLSPGVIWPPNGGLVNVVAAIAVTDSCDAEPSVELVSINSNEPDDGLGDGSSSADIQQADVGTDDRELQLRANRSGTGSGRIYTATYRASDFSGHTTEASAEVLVPHDRGKRPNRR